VWVFFFPKIAGWLVLAIQCRRKYGKIHCMKITDIVNRQNPPQPWEEGEKIPWDEPEFSKRMLKEHLSQDHNAASRRFEIVHRQVDWLERLAGGLERDLKVLDLACGPGLHSLDFARRGHSTHGIDFSPASIEWA
jgi:SAM-dependent methyltransferase